MRIIHGNRLLKGKIVDYKFEIASSWDQLNLYQHISAINVLRTDSDRFVKACCLLAILYEHHWEIITEAAPDELHGMAELTNFMFDEKPAVGNPLPMIRMRKKEYHAPADDLTNLVFGEWCFAYQFQADFHTFKDPGILDKLIATIYRERNPSQKPDSPEYNGDIREKFNENLIDTRARMVKDIPLKAKEAIYTWFLSALFQVMEARPKTFPLKGTNDDDRDSNDMDGNRTWLTVFRELLGPKWGTMEQLKFTNALFVLDGLEEARIEYEKAMRPSSS